MGPVYVPPPGQPGGGDSGARAAGFADYAAYERAVSSGGAGGFNFDYAKEAEKAYGELGAYYVRILEEAKGDMNKVLSRLTEDYDRGLRIKREDTTRAIEGAERGVVDNALARGLYQSSGFDPNGQRGLYDENRARALDPIRQNQQRYEEEALINKQRQEMDIPEEFKRKEFALEQERREKAAGLAEQRGARAYQDFQLKNLYNPSLT